MQPELSVKEIEIIKEKFENYKYLFDANSELYSQTKCKNFFLSTDYIKNVIKFSSNSRFYAYIFYDESKKIIAILFLEQINSGLIKKFTSLGRILGNPGVLTAGPKLETIYKSLIRYLGEKYNFYYCSFYPSVGISIDTKELNGNIDIEYRNFSPYVSLMESNNQGLVFPRAKRLKQKLKSLEYKNPGQFRLELITGSTGVELMDIFSNLHISYWEKSIFTNVKFEYNLFLKELLCYAKDFLPYIAVLYYNKECISLAFLIESQDTCFYWIPVFKKEYSDLIPGHMLIFKLLEHYSKKGFKEFDFLNSSESYKYKWTNLHRPRLKIHLYSHKFLNLFWTTLLTKVNSKLKYEIKKLNG